jgi:CheY-like chemotaxis protein
MDAKRILLAEDDPNDVELTLAALEGEQLTDSIDVVRDAVEALDYLYRRGAFAKRSTGHPRVVLLDLKMPRLDGLEVLRQIKQDPAFAALPIVVLTSSRQEQDIAQSYDLGANAYVVKPVAFDEFATAIHRTGLFWLETNERPQQARSF